MDECEENARNELIAKLIGFASPKNVNKRSSFSLKFLVTSRPYDTIEQRFKSLSGTSTYLRFDGDEKSQKISQEINLVIDAEIPNITEGFSDESRELISHRLKTMNNRTYLWLHLTIDIIKNSRSKYGKASSINTLLSDLPTKVSDAYERILDKSSDKDCAQALLQIIVAATRPLGLAEANIALALACHRGYCDSPETIDSWPPQDFKSTVQNICGLFVSVHDEKLSLIHQTAREFLIERKESSGIHPSEWRGCFKLATAHSTMFKICLRYLNFDEFADPINRVKTSDQYQYNREIYNQTQERRELYPLFDYAALNWATHYHSQDEKSIENSRTAIQLLCNKSLPPSLNWFQVYLTFSRELFPLKEWTKLEVASFFGLCPVIENCLNEAKDLDSRNDSHNALYLASHGGHDKVVKMLLDRGANVNEGRNMSSLRVASAQGYEKVVQILLEYGADVKTKNENHMSALHAASYGGFDKVVQILLDKGADANNRAKTNETVLQTASVRGYDKVVQILLANGADFNARDKAYETVLHKASFEGFDKVVKTLLEHGADVNAKSKLLASPLHFASHAGHDKVVKVLLRYGADINAQDKKRKNALHYASSQGCEKVVQNLLQNGADVNAETANHQSALQIASLSGYDKSVQNLLKRGADINAQDAYKKTALHSASEQGHTIIVQILLESGANVCQEDLQGRNSIHLASAKGERQIVERLVAKLRSLASDLTLVDGQGRNCLHHAACGGFAGLASWLIENGIDPNVADRDGWTALHWAAKHRSLDDNDWAAKKRLCDTVEVLIRAGAKSTLEAIEGWTPHLVATFHANPFNILNAPVNEESMKSRQSTEDVVEPSAAAMKFVSSGTSTGIKCDGCSLVRF